MLCEIVFSLVDWLIKSWHHMKGAESMNNKYENLSGTNTVEYIILVAGIISDEWKYK